MKVRDSGMPDERIWNTFFDVDNILDTLLIIDSTPKRQTYIPFIPPSLI